MTCNECKSQRTPESVPYIVHESAMVRNERSIKRLVIALVTAILLIFLSNAVWLYAWVQYDYSSEEVVYQQDGEGTNIIGDSNEVDNGAESDSSQTDPEA